jgi:choline dehydrogenase
LEAGGRQPLEAMAVPPAWPSLERTSVDWADTTVALTASGRTMRWARGRVLGGSSAINGMIFMRGHRSSYDAWPVAGATGWGFDVCCRTCGAASIRSGAIRRTAAWLARLT